MTLYDHNQVPGLPRRVVDMANADIEGYHRQRKAFDSVFVAAVLAAQQRVHLEWLKQSRPGRRVADPWWRFGFLPQTCLEFDDQNDAERLLAERNQCRRQREFAQADAIRHRLEAWGYEIGDEPGGTNWLVLP